MTELTLTVANELQEKIKAINGVLAKDDELRQAEDELANSEQDGIKAAARKVRITRMIWVIDNTSRLPEHELIVSTAYDSIRDALLARKAQYEKEFAEL